MQPDKILAARFVFVCFEFQALSDMYFIWIFLCGTRGCVVTVVGQKVSTKPAGFAPGQQYRVSTPAQADTLPRRSYIPKPFLFYPVFSGSASLHLPGMPSDSNKTL